MKFQFQDAPVTVKKFEPRLEDHDKQRVKTVRVWLEMNRSAYFQHDLFDGAARHGSDSSMDDLIWDDAENKRPGLQQLSFDSVFTGMQLKFVENGSFRVELKGATVEKITAKPVGGKSLQVKFQALAIITDGDLDALHDILKSNGVNLSATQLAEVATAATG